MPGPLHRRQHADQRQLDLSEQLGGAALGQVGVERVGELSGRERALGERLRRLGLVVGHVERQLASGRGVASKLAPGVPQRQVGQVERPLARQGQVGGQRGVAGQPVQLQAARGERVHRALGVVQCLRRRLVGEPVGQRLLVFLRQRRRIDERGRARFGRAAALDVGAFGVAAIGVFRPSASVSGRPRSVSSAAVCLGEREPGDVAGASAPRAVDRDPDPAAPGVSSQPAGQLALADPGERDVEAGLSAGRRRGAELGDDPVGQRGVEPVAQHPELERVEELVDLIPAPGHGHQIGGADIERHVPRQLGELAVAEHVAQVFSQVVPGPALDLVHLVDQRRQ